LPNTTFEEAILVLKRWQELQTSLRVTVELDGVFLDSDATLAGVDTLCFGLNLPGPSSNSFEIDFGTCSFGFGLDPNAPDDRSALVCIRLDGKIVFVAKD